MKKLYIVLLLVSITTAGIFAAETPEKVKADAQAFLETEQGKSDANRQFLDESKFSSFEDRQKLNEYRSKFNAVDAKIYVLKNQISVALKSRTPDMNMVNTKHQQLQTQVDEHDKLLSEYKQWVSSLK